MAKRIYNVNDIMSQDDQLPPLNKPDEFLNLPFECNAVSQGKGVYGEFVVLDIVLLETGEQYHVSCGGTAVMRFALAAKTKGLFPFRAKFVRSGRSYMLAQVDIAE